MESGAPQVDFLELRKNAGIKSGDKYSALYFTSIYGEKLGYDIYRERIEMLPEKKKSDADMYICELYGIEKGDRSSDKYILVNYGKNELARRKRMEYYYKKYAEEPKKASLRSRHYDYYEYIPGIRFLDNYLSDSESDVDDVGNSNDEPDGDSRHAAIPPAGTIISESRENPKELQRQSKEEEEISSANKMLNAIKFTFGCRD